MTKNHFDDYMKNVAPNVERWWREATRDTIIQYAKLFTLPTMNKCPNCGKKAVGEYCSDDCRNFRTGWETWAAQLFVEMKNDERLELRRVLELMKDKPAKQLLEFLKDYIQ